MWIHDFFHHNSVVTASASRGDSNKLISDQLLPVRKKVLKQACLFETLVNWHKHEILF